MTGRSRERTQRRTVDGVDLVLEDTGHGPPILFIHGFPLDRTIWRHQLDHLSSFRCIAPDLRGMGQSGAPAEGYSIGRYAADLVRVLDALEVERAGVCGLSMGGYIALEFVRSFGKRVAALALMDTRAEADDPAGREARLAMAARARQEGLAGIVDDLVPKLVAPENLRRDDVVPPLRRMMRATPLAGFVGALEAMRNRSGYQDVLAGLGSLPTLVVVGAQDAVTPPALAKRMAASIPGAAFVEVSGAGHLVPMEQPETTTGLLRDFFGGVKPPDPW